MAPSIHQAALPSPSIRARAGIYLFLFALGGPAAAHTGDRVLLVPQLSDDDLAIIDVNDGSIDDWLTVFGQAPLTHLDFELPPEPTLAFRIWLGWHGASSRIFVAVETVDDVFLNTYSGAGEVATSGQEDLAMARNDGFLGIGVDGDHSGDRYFDGVGMGYFDFKSTAQAYRAIGIAAAGKQLALLNLGGKALQPLAEQPPLADCGGVTFSERPTVTITEACVTAFDLLDRDYPSSRLSLSEAERTIGLALKVHDVDEDPLSTLEWGGKYRFPGRWGGELANYETADHWIYNDSAMFADAILLPRRQARSSAPNWPSLTWARLKARFDADLPGVTGEPPLP